MLFSLYNHGYNEIRAVMKKRPRNYVAYIEVSVVTTSSGHFRDVRYNCTCRVIRTNFLRTKISSQGPGYTANFVTKVLITRPM